MQKLNICFILFLTFFILPNCSRKAPDYTPYKGEPEYLEDVTSAEKEYYAAYNQLMSLWEVPYEDLYIPTNYGTAHVIVAGDTHHPPLVLLHGMNASSAMWYPNVSALAKSHRVYAIDLLTEPGKSNSTTDINDTETVIEWYIEIFNLLELQNVELVGASKGGWLAVKLALTHPARVNRLVLLSPAQTFIWIQPGVALFSNIIFELAPNRERLEKVLGKMSAHVDKIPESFKELFYLATKRSPVDETLLEMQPFSEETLSGLQMPVLLLIGEKDVINNERSIEVARESLANLEAQIIKDAGHFLSMDQATKVNEEILNFLD